jgi:gliding motility-associated-like protein
MRKSLPLCAFFIFLFSGVHSSTFYWVHNPGAGTGTGTVTAATTNNVATATINIGGIAYYTHWSKTSGGVGAANLWPASTPITSTDDVIIDNSSITTFTATNYVINIDIPAGGLICKSFNASSYMGSAGKNLKVLVSTFLDVYGDLRLSASANFFRLEGTGATNQVIFNNTVSGTANVYFFNKPLVSAYLFVRSDGILNFQDSINSNHDINISTNDNIGTSGNVNFMQGATLRNFYLSCGKANFYKNMFFSNGSQIGNNSIITANKTVITNVGGFYSKNRITGGTFDMYKGNIAMSNTFFDNVELYFRNPAGAGGVSATLSITTNINTLAHFKRSNTYNIYCPSSGFVFNGSYKFFNISNSATPTMAGMTFNDTLLLNSNILFNTATSTKIAIANTGVLYMGSGYTYDFGAANYASATTPSLEIAGKLIAGSAKGCDSSITKIRQVSVFMVGAATQTVNNVQLYNSKITGTVLQRNINANNTDMGGNSNWIIGGLSYGVFPYNTVPYTGRVPRTLFWDNLASGGTYWSEKKWADNAISATTFNQCPPTYVDSVVVRPGSTLSLDLPINQCKSFVAETGASITLINRATNVNDSNIIFEVYGSFLLNQKINNRFNRNIFFKAWQTYPQIRTNGTNFVRGISFWAINTGTNNPSQETNPGTWTLLDSLNAFDAGCTFTPRALPSMPGCKKIANIKYPIYDAVNYFTNVSNIQNSPQHNLVLVAGKLKTNNQNIHTYRFWSVTEGTSAASSPHTKELYLGSSKIHLYDGDANFGTPVNAWAWIAADNGGRFAIYPGSSHIYFHGKSFMYANFTNNATIFKGLNYNDVTFMQFDNYTVPNTATSGIERTNNCNYHNITFYSGDNYSPQIDNHYRDTVNAIYIKAQTGAFSTAVNPVPSNSVSITVDTIYSINPLVTISGNVNVRKLLRMEPGSVLNLQPGRAITLFNAAATSAASPLTPFHARYTHFNTCDKPGILRYGGLVVGDTTIAVNKAGGAREVPFEVKYLNVIDDSLSVLKKVDATTNLISNALNWDVPTPGNRTLVFRGSVADLGGNWFDKTHWASITYPSGIKTESPVGECVPLCGDSVIFDNLSFQNPTHTCRIAASSYAYCGTMIWRTGAAGILDGQLSSILTICNSLYFNSTTTNNFLGQIVFSSGQPKEFIDPAKKVFKNQLFFNSSNPNVTQWLLLDSLATSCVNNIVGIRIDAGTLDTRGKNINTGAIWLNSLKTRGLYLHNSRVTLTPCSGTQAVWYLEGDFTKLRLRADSSDIYINPGSYFETWSANTISQRYNTLGGNKYNRITFTNTTGNSYLYLRSDTVNELYTNGQISWQYAQKAWVRKFNSNNITSSAQVVGKSQTDPKLKFKSVRIDSLLCNSPKNYQYGWDSVFVKDRIYVASGANINFARGGVTFLSNKCDVNIVGTPSLPIKLDAINIIPSQTIAIPGNSSYSLGEHYLRKDSGNICTDYAQIYNIWAIGNGSNRSAPFAGTWNNPTHPALTTAQAEVVDTTLASSQYTNAVTPAGTNPSGAAGFTYDPTLSGRARFTGGSNADFLTNAKGWDNNPYPPAPTLTLTSINKNLLCGYDSVLLSFSGTGQLPFVLTYTYSGGTKSIGLSTSSQLNSYNSSTGAFTYTTYMNAGTSGTVSAGVLIVDRCFNSIGSGGGSYSYTINPSAIFSITNISPAKLCAGQNFTLTATSASTLNTLSLWSAATGGTQIATGTANGTFSYTINPGLGSTVYWLEGKTPLNCTAGIRKSDSILVASLPVAPTANSTQTCSGTVFNVNATAPAGIYNWYSGSSGGGSLYSGNTYTGTATTNTVYYVEVTSAPTNTYAATNASGTGTVVATFTTNCTSNTRSTVNVSVTPTPVTATVTPSVVTLCEGNTINLNASGSTGAYTWTGPASYTANGATQSISNATVSQSGTYTVLNTVTSGTLNCYSIPNTVSVTVNPTPLAAGVVSNSVTVCAGQAVNISISPFTAGVNYTWNGPSLSAATGSLQTITNSSTGDAGIYNVTPSIGSCNGALTTVTVSVNSLPPVAGSSSAGASVCSGNSSVLTASGADTYTWTSGPASAGYTVTPSVTTTYSFAGTNTVTGCTNTTSIMLIVNTTPTVAIASVSNPTLCSGNSTTITPGGASTYTLNPGALSGSSFVVTPGATTQYTLSGTSGANCPSGNSVNTTINVNATPTVAIASVSNPTLCSGNSTTITAGGASTYTLNPGALTGTNFVVTPATTTQYTLTGTSGANCPGGNTANTIINVYATPTVAIASVTNPTLCSNNSATITPGGASTYTMNPGALTGTSFVVTPAGTTQYTITGTSSVNCPGGNAANTTINVNITPTVAIASVSNPTLCSGNSTTITPGGASTYTLNPGALSGSSFVVTPGTTTQYTLSGTSGANCPSGNSVNTTINVNVTPTVAIASVSNPTLCSGNSATITPGGAFTYTLNPGALTGTSFVVTPAATTQYTLTGTSSANCVGANGATTLISVNVTPTVAIASVSNATICSGNSSTITPNGAFTYTLNPGGFTGTNFVVSPGTTTQYTLTGASSANCSSANTDNTIITVNNTPTVSVASVSNPILCSGNSTTITPGGASTYTLNPGALTGSAFVVTPATTTQYTLTGSSGANCPNVNAAGTTITVYNTPVLPVTSYQNVQCLGTNSGSATVTPASGSGPYTVTWDGSVTGVSNASLSVGSHTAVVIDIAGCTTYTTLVIAAPSSSLNMAVVTTTTGCGMSNGTATVTPSGGWNSSYTYTITDVSSVPVSNSSMPTGLGAGSYYAYVSDANNCVLINLFNVSNPITPTITATTSNSVICSGATTTLNPGGAATFTITGGAGPLFTSGAITVNPPTTTVYNVTGTDGGNCVSSAVTITVVVNATPTVALSASSNTICSGNVTTIIPTGADTYTLNPGNVTSTFTVNPNVSTQYTLTGTSIDNCLSGNSGNITITVNATPTISIASVSSPTICSGNTTTITPTGALTYTIMPGNTTGTSFSVSPNAIETYTINGESAANCPSNLITTVINVNITPTVSIAASSNTICSNNVVTITPSGANTYTLNPGNITSTFTVSPLSTTGYTLVGLSSANCPSGNAAYTTIDVNITPTISIALSSNPICSGNTATVIPSGASSYTLNPGNITTGFSVSPTTTTQYTLNGASAANCPSSNTVNITLTVNATPTVTGIADPVTVCNSGNIVMTTTSSEPGTSYTWVQGNGINATNQNSQNQNFPATVLSPNAYNYTVTGTALNCPSLPVVVTVNVITTPNSTVAQPNLLVCQYTNGDFIIANPQGGVVYNWTLDNGFPATGNTYHVPVPIVDSVGTYTVNVLAVLGNCNSTSNALLTIVPRPSVTVTNTLVTVCLHEAPEFDVLNPVGTSIYNWYVGTAFLQAGTSYVIKDAQLEQTGTYTITVMDNNKCVNSNTVSLVVNDCTIHVPQILTPNGDGKNDELVIRFIDLYPNNKVQVYNRWGSLVYSKDGYTNDWKGTNEKGNGGVLPAGTYFILVDLGDGFTKPYNGYIQLEY